MKHLSLKFKNEKGFSLVEMCVVLIIFSMVATIILGLLKHYTGNQFYQNTLLALDGDDRTNGNIAVLNAYAGKLGRYPCPADPTLGPNDANYGREAINLATNECTLATVPGRRDTNGDGTMDPVVIGTIPFKTLIDPKNDGEIADMDSLSSTYRSAFALDGWGRKFTYAVTKSLTNISTFDQDGGTIAVEDEKHNNLLNTPNSAHYVILSHGEDGIGAYAENGPRIPCTTGVVLPPPVPPAVINDSDETENCNFFDLNDATFLNGLSSMSSDLPYDDIIRIGIATTSELWAESTNSTEQIPKIYAQDGGNVGIGKTSPQEKVHVTGNIEADAVHANSICNAEGSICLPIENIAGEIPDMKCANAGEVITKIDYDSVSKKVKVTCAPAFDASILKGKSCPSGQIMTGLSSKTGIICTFL